MRVALLIDELATTGGGETQIRLLMRSFERKRVDPTLVLLRGALPAPDEIGEAPVERLGIGRLRSRDALRKASAFAGWARENAIELLWAFFPDASLVGWLAARGAGLPLVLNQRNIGVGAPRPLLERSVERFVMGRADACVANSEAARRYAATRGVTADRLAVIPNAVDTQRFRPAAQAERRRMRAALGLAMDDPLIGCVANHRPVKGIADLLRAFASLRAKRVAQLVLVGDGEQRPELEALAASLGIERDVAFLGRRTDVEGIAPCFDVAVLPSHAEGSSNALLELLACGAPSVATAVGGNPEALCNGELGSLVPPADPPALARALGRLLDDPERCHALALRGRAHVVSHFEPAAIALDWERVFRDAIERRAAR